MNPKITIIIPVYNTSGYLSRCLESVLNQSLHGIEILIINDCSTDNSVKIIESYAKKNGNLFLIHNNKNIGLGATRNRGIEKANGKYILFVDSDDWIDLKTCEILYEIAENYQLDILLGNYLKIYSHKITSQILESKNGIIVTDGKSFMQKNDFFTAVWDKLWLRKFIINNNLKNEVDRYSEDVPMVVEGLLSAQRVAKIEFKFYNYFQGNKLSITKSKLSNKHLSDRIWVISYLLSMKEKNKETNVEKSLDLLLSKQLNPALSNIRRYSGTEKELKKELLDKICYVISITRKTIFKDNEVPFYKRFIAYISPNFYIKLFTCFDKLKAFISS